MYRVIRINDNGANQPADLIILPGSYEGSGAARQSITETGEYFLINTFNYKDDGTKPTSPDNSQGEAAEKAAPQHKVDGSNKEGQQAAEIGKVSSAQKEGSAEKEKSSSSPASGKTKKSSSGPASSTKKKS